MALACWLIFIAALFDVFDGLAARALGGGSELGKQLDSLADMVSFGVAPGFIVYQLVGRSFTLWFTQHSSGYSGMEPWFQWSHLPALSIALVIPIAAAWRLAKFNIDPRQTQGFLGLPSPANALFWAGLFLGISHHADSTFLRAWTPEQWQLLFRWLGVLVVALAALMLVEVPLPSLKLKHFGWRGNEVMWLLGGSGAALLLLMGMLAVPAVLLLYLLTPVWGRFFPSDHEDLPRLDRSDAP